MISIGIMGVIGLVLAGIAIGYCLTIALDI